MRSTKDKDFDSPKLAAAYLQELVDCKPMTITVDGGGLQSPQTISPETLRVIGVWELERIIKLLEAS